MSLRHADRTEQRVLYDRECDALAEAALLVISLAFEGERAPPPPEPQARASRVVSTGLALAPLLRLDGGSLPHATLGLGGALRLYVERTTLEVEAAWYVPRERELQAAGGRFELVGAALRACQDVHRWRWLAIAPCAAVELGRARGEGTGMLVRRKGQDLWGAVLVGISLPIAPTGRLSPIADLELGLPFKRPSFDVDGVGTLFQARGTLVRASLRLALRLL